MSQKEIARVRLSKGRVGYFDDLTRIHLTISRPEAIVYSSMNTKNLKRSVHSGVLRLVSGSLELEKPKAVKDLHVTQETKAAVEATKEPVVVTVELTPELPKEVQKEEPVAEATETAEEPKEVAEETEVEEVETAQAEEPEVSEPEATETKAAPKKRRTTTKQ